MVEPDQGIDVVPPGWYNVSVDESAMKPTKDGAGAYLALRFNILDGQYAKRKVFTNLNLKNANAETVEIAQKQLSAICHAVGVLRPQDSNELHGKPLKIKVKIRPASGQYSESNDITSYKNVNEAVDTAGGDSAAGAASFGAGAPANPWATGAAAEVAGAPATPPAEPAAPAAPVAPAAPEAPAAPHDPIAAAEADGWAKHPTSPGWHYKGADVVKTDSLGEKYPGVPAAPAAPAAPVAPTGDPAAAQGAAPPWAQPKT